MKFSEYPYHTIDVNEAKQKLQDLKERLINAKDYEAFKKAFQDLDIYKKEIYTQFAKIILMKLHPFYKRIWFKLLMWF